MRSGADTRLPIDKKTGRSTHTFARVYGEMLLQICRDYTVLPEPRSLTLTEIRFFYEGLRPELRRYSRPRAKK